MMVQTAMIVIGRGAQFASMCKLIFCLIGFDRLVLDTVVGTSFFYFILLEN
jgi:hypothetical protein